MLSGQDRQLSELLLLLYDAAQNADLWPEFLSALSKATQARGAALFIHDLGAGKPLGVWTGYEDAEAKLYIDYFASVNPWMPNASLRLPESNVVRGESFLSLAQLKNTEFYNDWGRRNETAYSIAANLKIEEQKLLYLSVGRGELAGAFSEDVPGLLSFLLPHLQRAIQIHDRLRTARLTASSLDSMAAAVFIIDSEARILHMSQSAQQIAEDRDGFAIVEKHFLRVPEVEIEQLPFETILAEERERARTFNALPRATRVTRPAGSYYLLFLLPLGRSKMLFPVAGEFAVVVMPPDPPSTMAIKLFGYPLFELSAAERRLAAALLKAGTLTGATTVLSINYETARSQLTRILQKTGTQGQGDLIRLLTVLANVTHLGEGQ